MRGSGRGGISSGRDSGLISRGGYFNQAVTFMAVVIVVGMVGLAAAMIVLALQ